MVNDVMAVEMVQGKSTRRAVKENIAKSLLYVILLLIAIVCVGPYFWLFSASFKANTNIYDLTLFSHLTLANYTGVVAFMQLQNYFFNSIVITVGGTAIDVIFSSLCAYPLAKLDFYGKRIITGVLVSAMILPAAAGMVVNYLTISHLHLLGNLLGAILPSSVSVFSIILLRQSYLAIPRELMEAARIDGASEFNIWAKVMIPCILPSISTVIIFDFINKWNAFLWPMIVLNAKQYPIASALQTLSGEFNYRFGYVAASTFLSIVPIVIIFLLFQKYYLNTIAGAIKS